ncbi:MAG: Gfo/Idh/MocA family oxidoreductase [Clostridia bacterium]|nr:Gfo/Idh/MocA family oxidoreductase [Clostridia bacterium]
MKHINIGLIGFGFMGKTHLWSVKNLPFFYDLPFTAEVAAVCASADHPERSEAVAKTYGIPRAADEAAIIHDPTIDVIDICTPNPHHFETAKAALRAGKHVLCEKPLTVTAAEARELADLARASGLTCGTVFNNRYLAPVMRAKQLIDTGRLGRILSFDFSYKHNSCIDPERRVGWKQTAEAGGGTLFDLGPHVIDLCHFLCGKVAAVTARSQIAFPTHLRSDGSVWETNAGEAFYMICELESGAIGNITVSKLTQGANDELSFSVCGTLGSLSFSLMDPNYLNFYDATVEGSPIGGVRGRTRIECVGRYPSPATGFPTPKAPVGWLRGHIGSMAAYLTAVYEDRPASPSFADGAYVQSVMEAAQQSAETRREVSLC